MLLGRKVLGLTISMVLVSSIVIQAAGPNTPTDWFAAGQQAVKEAKNLKANLNHATNVILFIGDGMGIATVTAARILEGQMRGESGEENLLSFEKFPYITLSKT